MTRHAARPPATVIGTIVLLLRPHRAGHGTALRRLAAYSVLESLPTLSSGVLVGRALDGGLLAGRTVTGLAWLAALAGVWIVAAAATRMCYPWLAETVEPLRDSLLTAVVAACLRSATHSDEAPAVAGGSPNGSSVSQVTVQVETVRGLVSAVLRTLRHVVVAGLASLGGLALLSPVVAVGAAVCAVLAVLLFGALLTVLVTRYRAVVLAGERVSELAAPVVEGVRDVIAAGAAERMCTDLGRAIEAEAEAARALARARAWRLPLVTLGAHLPLVALLAGVPWLSSTHGLSTGDVIGGVVYLSTGLEPAIQLLVNAGGTLLVGLGVVLTRLAEVTQTSVPIDPVRPADLPAHLSIDLVDVTFRYSPRSAPVIRDLSLWIPEGAYLAVVGPSGTGKSTLANVLTRLTLPSAGSVRLGDVPLEAVDEACLRRLVALVPQEAYLVDGTVRENLTYLRPEATDAEVVAAVGAVGAAGVVAQLGGLDAHIDPSTAALTPGSRQLIVLARVCLSPAGVVVLDEATCHLDPAAEARAEQAFAARPGTLIVIAHRLSSARRAHRILVMDHGSARLGTHEELLDRDPCYRDLVSHWDGEQPSPPATGRCAHGW